MHATPNTRCWKRSIVMINLYSVERIVKQTRWKNRDSENSGCKGEARKMNRGTCGLSNAEHIPVSIAPLSWYTMRSVVHPFCCCCCSAEDGSGSTIDRSKWMKCDWTVRETFVATNNNILAFSQDFIIFLRIVVLSLSLRLFPFCNDLGMSLWWRVRFVRVRVSYWKYMIFLYINTSRSKHMDSTYDRMLRARLRAFSTQRKK